MNSGTVELIYIAPAATAATLSVKQAVAIPGSGLEGDRYALGQGRFPSLNPTSN